MVRCILLSLVATGLASACAVDSGIPNFERMSEEQLAEYNSNRPLAEMIICSESGKAFSRVRRRTCATVGAAYGSAGQAEQLGVLNNIPGYINDESF